MEHSSFGTAAVGGNGEFGAIAAEAGYAKKHLGFGSYLEARRVGVVAAGFTARKCLDYPESTYALYTAHH